MTSCISYSRFQYPCLLRRRLTPAHTSHAVFKRSSSLMISGGPWRGALAPNRWWYQQRSSSSRVGVGDRDGRAERSAGRRRDWRRPRSRRRVSWSRRLLASRLSIFASSVAMECSVCCRLSPARARPSLVISHCILRGRPRRAAGRGAANQRCRTRRMRSDEATIVVTSADATLPPAHNKDWHSAS